MYWDASNSPKPHWRNVLVKGLMYSFKSYIADLSFLIPFCLFSFNYFQAVNLTFALWVLTNADIFPSVSVLRSLHWPSLQQRLVGKNHFVNTEWKGLANWKWSMPSKLESIYDNSWEITVIYHAFCMRKLESYISSGFDL